jgi:hypothetical protein
MRYFKSIVGPASSGLFILAIVIVAASLSLGGNGSGVSKEGVSGGGSFVRAIVDGMTFTHTLTAGELAEDARDALAALVDAHPNYTASPTTVPPGPFEPTDVFFEVLTSASGDPNSQFVCENDANYENSGVQFDSGRSYVVILKPTAVAGGGSFNIRLDMSFAADVNETINTSAGDVTGLISGIISALQGLGFTVTDTGSQLYITKTGDTVLAARIESTDTLFNFNCLGLTNSSPPQPPQPPTDLPALHVAAVVLLVTGLLLAGILMLRRKARI